MFKFSMPECTLNITAEENLACESGELDKLAYDGNDLGSVYTPESTTFKVWSPTASEVTLNLYRTGSDAEEGAENLGSSAMGYDETNGVWSVTAEGDLKNVYYTYTVKNGDKVSEVTDLYAKAVGVNGDRGMVVELEGTNPVGWNEDKRVLPEHQTEAVVWEVHVRDFSENPNSGVSEAHRGKYLAFTELETVLPEYPDIPTGIQYIKSLGVTHVQINPMYDFGSVDETKAGTSEYNWGYDPKNYNAPEGSYSTNPYDGNIRINELKQMVQALHSQGIGVIMDVVYNHTYENENSFFNLTVPKYYYRFNDDGSWMSHSFCGDDTASERAMYSKFMVDSVYYWATEYHLDGFRFDIMSLHDLDTMRKIREKLDTIDSRILMYGEAWDMGEVEGIEFATQKNISKLDRVAAFNDGIRDSVKGSVFEIDEKGFVQGAGGSKKVTEGILGATGEWADTPESTVTFISCHDNMTLYDKLVATVLGKDDPSLYRKRNEEVVAMNKLGAAITFTSQGMPFILAGEEMARSKDGEHNSYKSSPELNMIDWNNLAQFGDVAAYYKGLIDLRKFYAPFSDSTRTTVDTMQIFEDTDDYTIAVAYCNPVADDTQWEKVVCVFNGDTQKDIELEIQGEDLPESWVVVVNGEKAGVESLGCVDNSKVLVPKSSAVVLVDKESFDRAAVKADTKFKDILFEAASTFMERNTKAIVKVDDGGKKKKKHKVLKAAGIIVGSVAVAATVAGVAVVKGKKRNKK